MGTGNQRCLLQRAAGLKEEEMLPDGLRGKAALFFISSTSVCTLVLAQSGCSQRDGVQGLACMRISSS